MKLRAKVITATQQRPMTTQASTPTTRARPSMVLLKFATSEDRHAALRGRKDLTRTKLGLDKDLTPSQQVSAMVVVQGGQGGKQARLLACSRTLH
jgi:hypothetical protein